jgi:hypothetical protein
MAGIKSLSKVQLGQEATAGTEVAATAVLHGMGRLEDLIEVVKVETDVGIFSGPDYTYIAKYEGQLAVPAIEASYQQIHYPFAAGVENIVSGTQDGAGTDYIYQYDVATTAAPAVKTFTIEAGDNQQEEQMLYGHCVDFTISGEGGGPVMIASNWRGRQVATGTYTGSVAVPTVEPILFSKGRLYIDNSGGTFGTTQVSNSLLAMNLSFETGIVRKWTADNSLDFGFIQYTKPTCELQLTWEHNASAVSEKAAWRAETVRMIQLLFEGSAFGTGGTTYSNHSFIINLVGKWTKFDALSDQDGNNTTVGTFTMAYNATDAAAGQFITVNELTVLT